MKTHIARLGEIIGELSDAELSKGLADGTIKGGDHWWRPGMKEWKSIAAESPLPASPIETPNTTSKSGGDWRIRPTHISSRYGDEPATEKQLALIKDAGLTDVSGLTKYDASRWIDLILSSDAGVGVLNDGQFRKVQETQKRNESVGLGCGGHRTPSGQFRKEIKSCLKSIEEKREETRKNIEEEPEEKKYYLSDLKDAEKEFQLEISEQMKNRVEYWIWVIKCGREKNRHKQWQMMVEDDGWSYSYMYVETALADRLFAIANSLHKIPAKKDVSALLAKLDAASEDWDDTQPELLLLELSKGVAC